MEPGTERGAIDGVEAALDRAGVIGFGKAAMPLLVRKLRSLTAHECANLALVLHDAAPARAGVLASMILDLAGPESAGSRRGE